MTTGRYATLAPNVGAIADLGQLTAELPSLDGVNAVKVVTDLVGRLSR